MDDNSYSIANGKIWKEEAMGLEPSKHPMERPSDIMLPVYKLLGKWDRSC